MASTTSPAPSSGATPTAAPSTTKDPITLLSTILRLTEERIIPLTSAGVSSGSKVFGAAILSRSSLRPLSVSTNNERESPLLHGEINCIQQYFTLPLAATPEETDQEGYRIPTKDTIFFATHEPCSLCLSGITWAGFNEFYYLFTYEDSRDLFAIPYDIEILEEVFRVKAPGDDEKTLRERPLYNRRNKFFTGRSLLELLDEATEVGEEEKEKWRKEIKRVKELYDGLSKTYQEGKTKGVESASVWK
ncbi:cytidine deaminase-like protein [Sordaria brevicollis]|uniref:Cytidine deaminase-like protein n=1 Tax=Sordaria brevicollis TaxID=83679 RepID=A0AAE0PLP4_SORBR|nr:cytidine deaminase-like protein [Sordaria brevicollis]